MRSRFAIPIFIAIALLASACGGPTAGEAVAQASEKTTDSGSSRVFFEATVEAPAAPQPLHLTGEGVSNYDSRQSELTLDLSEMMPQAGTGGGEVQAIFDDLVLYMKADFLQQAIPNSKPWIKVDYEAAARQQGLDLTQLNQLGQQDPALQLSFLEGLTQNGVEEIGTEEVRGTETTHYRATVDLEKVADRVPEGQRSQFDDLIEASGEKTIPIELWLDADGLLRRLTYDFETDAGRGETAELSFVFELYDFGVETDIQPPPEDQTTDLLQLLREQGAFGE